MKGYCRNCEAETRWAVNHDRAECICMGCNRVEGVA